MRFILKSYFVCFRVTLLCEIGSNIRYINMFVEYLVSSVLLHFVSRFNLAYLKPECLSALWWYNWLQIISMTTNSSFVPPAHKHVVVDNFSIRFRSKRSFLFPLFWENCCFEWRWIDRTMYIVFFSCKLPLTFLLGFLLIYRSNMGNKIDFWQLQISVWCNRPQL